MLVVSRLIDIFYEGYFVAITTVVIRSIIIINPSRESHHPTIDELRDRESSTVHEGQIFFKNLDLYLSYKCHILIIIKLLISPARLCQGMQIHAKKDRRAKSFFLTHDKQTQDANCEHQANRQPPASTNSRIVIQQRNFKLTIISY